LPTYQERFMAFSHQLGGWLESVGAGGSREAIPDLLDPDQAGSRRQAVLSNASGLFAMGFLVLLATIFILLEAPTIPAKLRAAFHLTEEGDARLKRLLDTVNRYMQIKTLTSLGTATCTWLLLRVFGVDFAILWAVLAFFLNFVPVLGNILMMIPPVLLALIQTDPCDGAARGHRLSRDQYRRSGTCLSPRIMGKGLGVSTLAIFHLALVLGLAVRHRGHVPRGTSDRRRRHRPGREPSYPPPGHPARPGDRRGGRSGCGLGVSTVGCGAGRHTPLEDIRLIACRIATHSP
jgi:AI-2 transport protein TqsA